jgi:hypothetical protein
VEDKDRAKTDESRRLAARPLGQQLAKFPLRFASAVFFGQPPSRDAPAGVNNGTVTLMNLGAGPIAVTCAHVLAEYRDLRESGKYAVFQIGNVNLDPLAQVIAEDRNIDLATIRLSEGQAARIRKDGLFDTSFFEPSTWPPPPVKESDVVALGGFPGTWRETRSFNELDFPSFSIGATMVTCVAEDHIACQFDRDRWLWPYRADGLKDLRDLGGLSGGPAFVHRGLHYDFVGIIYEFNSEFDIMLLRPAHFIRADGLLERSNP